MIKLINSKVVVTILFVLGILVPVFAQRFTSVEMKSLEKAKNYYNKGKYDQAITTLKKVQQIYFYDNYLWDLRCGYEYDRYNKQFKVDYAKALKAKQKGVPKSDNNLAWAKSTQYRKELIYSCSTASLVCGKQETASMVLHELFIEPLDVDAEVKKEAKEIFAMAGVEYKVQNYNSAIRFYENALKADSNYFYANYRIGMCYFKDEKFELAVPYFKKAISIQPDMLNPRLKLVSCYMKIKNWPEAYSSCVNGIIAYPDILFFMQLNEIADKLGKNLNRHWMGRDYLPGILTITEQESVAATSPWSFYRSAKDKIGDYCNDYGVVKKKVDFTEQKYLEVFAWELMLNKTETEEQEFGFARKMQKEGYLDCFAMVSMYHISFSDQYIDFAKKNPDRIRKYIDTYLVK